MQGEGRGELTVCLVCVIWDSWGRAIVPNYAKDWLIVIHLRKKGHLGRADVPFYAGRGGAL
ncbi:hypothetical protein PG2022B_0390 [Bifidobacterium animalis subsp. animalis]|nr:hypothetical protein PG2022B_0390 [Bifidobacterium animalis subsp. animalis]